MKNLKYFAFILCFIACKATKKINTEKLSNTTTFACPEDGICTFEVLKNETYTIKEDEFGNSYSELLNGNKTVLKFEYKRNIIEGTQDSSYRERIYIEFDSKKLPLNLKDSDLKQVNLGFERLCFCRGQTGSYPITSGHLVLTNNKSTNEYTIVLDFKTDKVPQIITSINETFKL